MASGSDPEAPDWYRPELESDEGQAEQVPGSHSRQRELGKEEMSVKPADPSPEEGSRTDAGTQDDLSSDVSASDADTKLEQAAGELPFGADQPGFTDWRVELRERLKKIRARRESEQEEAEAESSKSGEEGIDSSEAPTLDDIGLDPLEIEEIDGDDLPELEQSLEQAGDDADHDDEIVDQENIGPITTIPGQDNVVELSDILGGSDLPLQTDTLADAEAWEVAEPTGISAEEEHAVVVEGGEILREEPLEEQLDETEEIGEEGAADKDTDVTVGLGGTAAAAGKAASGWDSDLIADLQAGTRERPETDAVAEALDPLAGMELLSPEPARSPEPAQSMEDAAEADEEDLVVAEEIESEDVAGMQIDAEKFVSAGGLAEEDFEDALVEEIDHEEAAPEFRAESNDGSGEEAAEEHVVDEADAELDEEAEDAASTYDVDAELDQALDVVPELESGDSSLDEMPGQPDHEDARELEFDEVDEAVVEPVPDLELDIDEIPASEADAGLEWDTPAPPELMRPATSGLDRSAAPLGQRVIAGIADALVLVIIAGVLVGAASSATGAAYDALLSDALLPLSLAWAIFAFGYSVFFTGTCGQTIGKMIMKLRVVSTDQLSVGFGRATKRLVASVPAILVLGIGFFLALRDPKRRTVYDRVAQTRVVRA